MTLIKRIEEWWWRRSFEKAKAALYVLIEMKDEKIYNEIRTIVNMKAEPMARQMCIHWLDQEGIQHCKICPNTKPLLRLEDGYYCASHATMIKKRQTETQKQAEEKKSAKLEVA